MKLILHPISLLPKDLFLQIFKFLKKRMNVHMVGKQRIKDIGKKFRILPHTNMHMVEISYEKQKSSRNDWLGKNP